MTSNVCLFNFSKIKSEHTFRISEYNTFYYDFSEYESIIVKESKELSKNEETQPHYIKKVLMNIPSNEKLKEENFRNEFFNSYENSFANFCGLDENLFKEIYEKNKYIPKINQVGDIIINIDNIIKNLKSYSGSKHLKIKRRRYKNHLYFTKSKESYNKFNRQKSSKIFNISKNQSKNISKDVSLKENILNEKNGNDIKSNKSSSKGSDGKDKENISYQNNISENNSKSNENKSSDKILLNIKKNLKNISITKPNKDYSNNININKQIIEPSKNPLENNIHEEQNNNILTTSNVHLKKDDNLNEGIFPFNNDNQYKSPLNQQDFIFSTASNKNNIFNFSSNPINDFDDDSQIKENYNYLNFNPMVDKEEKEINDLLLSPYQPFLNPFNFSNEKINFLFSPNQSFIKKNNINAFNDIFYFKNNKDENEEIEENDNKDNNNNNRFDENDINNDNGNDNDKINEFNINIK